MIVRDRAARSRGEVATMPPIAVSLSQAAASISKPMTGTLASIRRPDRAVPIRPSPMIPIGISTCIIGSPFPTRLLRLDTGGFGIRGPPDDLAADEGTEFIGAHRRDD